MNMTLIFVGVAVLFIDMLLLNFEKVKGSIIIIIGVIGSLISIAGMLLSFGF
ncbi:hypothetical protein HYT26_00970 [Candidatus Pacearchaeota archaeon]|nr:hypothetical protein [Candidatus Pacearchaeota archaeon]